jgi:hypothetical protein
LSLPSRPVREPHFEPGWQGQAHGCPVHFFVVQMHGIDSIRFQRVTNHLVTKKD